MTACNLYDSDCCLKNQFKSLRLASHFLQDVSSINFQDWDILKLATALKMVCYPEDDILFGNPDEVNHTNILQICFAHLTGTCHSSNYLEPICFRCFQQMSYQS